MLFIILWERKKLYILGYYNKGKSETRNDQNPEICLLIKDLNGFFRASVIWYL